MCSCFCLCFVLAGSLLYSHISLRDVGHSVGSRTHAAWRRGRVSVLPVPGPHKVAGPSSE